MSDETLVADDPTVAFRNVLSHFPTGVTVVAAVDGDRPVGLAVGSFFSVSLEPPLVGFCVMTTSSTWPVIEQCGRFGISVLAGEQTEICGRLATKDPDKFAGLDWTPAPVTGSPLIDGAVSHFDCTLEQQHPAGDHWIVVGRVAHLVLHRHDSEPMIFCRGTYGRFAQ